MYYLHDTHFLFQEQFYEQIEEVVMGFPVSPLVANLYMENLEVKALRTVKNP